MILRYLRIGAAYVLAILAAGIIGSAVGLVLSVISLWGIGPTTWKDVAIVAILAEFAGAALGNYLVTTSFLTTRQSS